MSFTIAGLSQESAGRMLALEGILIVHPVRGHFALYPRFIPCNCDNWVDAVLSDSTAFLIGDLSGDLTYFSDSIGFPIYDAYSTKRWVKATLIIHSDTLAAWRSIQGNGVTTDMSFHITLSVEPHIFRVFPIRQYAMEVFIEAVEDVYARPLKLRVLKARFP